VSQVLAPDVFAVPHGKGFLVYAPLAGRVIHANAKVVSQLRSYLETGDYTVINPEISRRLGGLEWLNARDVPQGRPPDAPFEPSQVTLFLSNRCNLRCVYCYADAGNGDVRRLPRRVAQAAIDLAAANAERMGRQLAVGFHGGGEPTLEWSRMVDAVEYARQTEPARRRPPRFGLATNGVVGADRAQWIAENFTAVTLSLDGPPEIQDRLRPTRGGGPSFETVQRFSRILKEQGTPVVVRCTVTRDIVDQLPDLVDFFAETTGAHIIHFEPVFSAGRALGQVDLVPSPEVFVDRFAEAMDRAGDRGVRVRHSVSRLYAAYPSFCGCSHDPLNVTPDGDLTACFEVCDRSNERSEVFVFGSWDDQAGSFKIDHERLARLRKMTIHDRSMCQGCIAKWNCSGDCPAKWDHGAPDADRCKLNRELTRELLVRTLDPKRCTTV